MSIEAELKRRDSVGTLQDWKLADDAASATGLADPVIDAKARTELEAANTKLAALQTRLDDLKTKLDTVATKLDTLIAKDFATQTTLAQLNAKDFATQATLAQVKTGIDALADTQTLTQRMWGRNITDNYRMWSDTANASYIYLAEAPMDAIQTDAVWRGIRIPLDANGNPLGEWQESTAFKWSDKSGTWS